MPAETDMTAEELARGERLFARGWRFVKSVVAIDGLPPARRPEIAFAGRSNVGKSSLINALVNHKGLARASNTPGRTQELNFFEVPGFEIYLVDMPGYGYAKAPKDKVDTWTILIKDYLRGRATLARVFVLVDARHGLKSNDEEILKLLDEAAVSYQIVLTKGDKISEQALAKVAAAAAAALKKHPAAFPEVIATSAEKGTGINALRATIARIAAERGAVLP